MRGRGKEQESKREEMKQREEKKRKKDTITVKMLFTGENTHTLTFNEDLFHT